MPKDDIRIEANGCLDELNAVIGIVRSMLAAKDAWQELLHAVQRELMVVMSHVATPSGVVNPNPLSAAELTLRCEQEMDAMTVLLTDNGYFLLPGGTPISAQLQFARTVARRAGGADLQHIPPHPELVPLQTDIVPLILDPHQL